MLSKGPGNPSFFYGYVIVSVAFLVLVIMSGLAYSFGVFLKPLSTEFGWTRAITSGAHSLTLFLHGLFFIVTGALNDRFGPRIVITVCGFLLGLGFLLMSTTSALWQLYLFWGIIVAIGASGGFVPLISTVARWFDRRRGMMTGIVASGVGIGMVIVPPLASLLILNYGWRITFIIIGSTALVLLMLAAQFLKRDPGQAGQLPYGSDTAKPKNLTAEARGLSLGEALHTRQFWMLYVMYFFSGFSLQTVMVHIVAHAIDLGIFAITASGILAVFGGFNAAGRAVMGSASDRFGNKPSLFVCFVLLLVSLIWLQSAGELWMLYLFAAIFGFGSGGFVGLESPVTGEFFGLKAHGAILGAIVFGVTTGGAIGSLLAGHIFDISGSYYLAFQISAALTIASLILVSLLKPAASKV